MIQKAIGDKLAKLLLAGEIRDGDKVQVDYSPGTGEAEGDAALDELDIYSLGGSEDE